jgi:membrane protease YdiL (CAAX protease family)
MEVGVMSVTSAARSPVASQEAATAPSEPTQVITVAWFVGLSLSLALVSSLAGAPAAVLPFILALGPTVIALALAWREGHGALGRLRHSLVLRPPRRHWYLILGLPVVWALATVGVAVLLGAPTADLFDAVFPNVAIIFLVVLVPAFAEEVAWRGFAVPRLMTVMSPLKAAVVIAIPWTLIHVGLFLPGQSNGELLLWPLGLSIVSYSVILTWLFVRTGGSILMVALVHAGLNAMSPVMAGVDPNDQWIIRNVLAGVIALAVVGLGGFRSVSRLETPR